MGQWFHLISLLDQQTCVTTTNVGETPGDAVPGDLIVFKESSGVAQHVMIIISSHYTVGSIDWDRHNLARHNYSLSSERSSGGFPSWYLLHIQTGA